MNDQQVKRLRACGFYPVNEDDLSKAWVDPILKMRWDGFSGVHPIDLTVDEYAAKFVLPMLREVHIHRSVKHAGGGGHEWSVSNADGSGTVYGDTFGRVLVDFLDTLLESKEVDA